MVVVAGQMLRGGGLTWPFGAALRMHLSRTGAASKPQNGLTRRDALCFAVGIGFFVVIVAVGAQLGLSFALNHGDKLDRHFVKHIDHGKQDHL